MTLPTAGVARKAPWLEASAYAAILVAALLLRAPTLDNRVMHGDEAVHAVKFATLLERGEYDYDPYEYHGPTPYYLALIAAKLRGQATYAALDEVTLRVGPAVVSSLAVLTPALLRCGLTPLGALLAAAFLAVSPSLSFYSRYFIQEPVLTALMLLALGAGWRSVRDRSRCWSAVAGGAIGAMIATKETAGIAVVAAGLAALIAAWRSARGRDGVRNDHVSSAAEASDRAAQQVAGAPPWALPAIAAGAAVTTLFLLITNFGRAPREFLDAFRAVAIYVHRGVGGEGLHLHPFGYYLSMLTFWRAADGGPIWSEAPMLLFAGIGGVFACQRPRSAAVCAPFAPFLACFAILLALAYSALPYKTPWSMTQFVAPLALLGGFGAARVARCSGALRTVGLLTLGAALGYATWQSRLATTRFENSYRNPYVYAHPLRDVTRMAEFVERLARSGPEGARTRIDVAHENPWPLPWYLRRLTRVGWWESAADWRDFVAAHGDAPIRITALSGQEMPAGAPCWAYGLRPDAGLRLCVDAALYDAFVQQADGDAAP